MAKRRLCKRESNLCTFLIRIALMKLHHALMPLLIAGCSALPKAGELGERSVVIKPQYGAGSITTQGTVNPYTSTDINHLTLELRYLQGDALAASLDLPKAQLNLPLTFNHLMANKGYRIKFKAYKAAGSSEADVISTSGPWLDFTTTTDDAPSILTLNVKLINKDFNGIATSSFDIKTGGYSYAASESIDLLPPLATTFAGTNQAGNVSGTLAQARFSAPSKLALDASGSLYISDTGNNAVRKIEGGAVSASFTTLTGPRGISVNSTDLYVSADGGIYALSSVTGTGSLVVSLTNSPYDLGVGSNGGRPCYLYLRSDALAFPSSGRTYLLNASFSNPQGLYINGDVAYVADTDHNQIVKLTGLLNFYRTSTPPVPVIYGDGTPGTTDGNATTARFNSPKGLALDSLGNLYVSDSGNHRIRKIDPDGNVTTYAGSSSGYTDAVGTSAQFNSPDGLAVDASDNLYVVDTGNHCIRYLKRVY